MATAARVNPPASDTGNIIRDSALGLVPETLECYLPLNAAIWDEGPLGPAEIELARLRSADHVGCVICKAVRYDIAVQDGLDESKVQALRGDDAAGTLGEREKLILAFTDQYLHDPAGLGEELRSRLQAAFTPGELVHLSLALAYFNGFSRCAVALGGMPDEMPRMEIAVPR